MARPENVMQVFSLLDKSNCRKCGEKTCLAFASAVFQQRRKLAECPLLDRETAARFEGGEDGSQVPSEAGDYFEELKKKAATIDLRQAADRVGGRFEKDRLTVKILGKDFSVDSRGELYSDIHIIPWVAVPFLLYVLECRGAPLTGDWIPYREVHGAAERYPLFRKRCEEAMRHIGDIYTDLFDDMVHLFKGKQVDSRFQADISVILPVFPLVPLLICYWRPDEGMASSLHVFFDRSVDVNLGGDAAFNIGAGLARMFEKLALRHGYRVGAE